MCLAVNQALKKRLFKKTIKTYADISNFIARISSTLLVLTFLRRKWTYPKIKYIVVLNEKCITP